ncbi:MAG TPA: ATP-binding protein [Chthoniobacteraceae bacterium]|jgi:two-component system phosphate regulon sensor histidine kinase PhoR|nr:ATP-binding protein [Chthoniobacteraceae bacterium]
MLKLPWIFGAVLALATPAAGSAHQSSLWLSVVGGAATAWCSFAGVWLWRQWLLFKQVEAALEQLAHGRPVDVKMTGDLDRAFSKAEARQAALQREAGDARFDLRAIMAGMEDGVLVSDHRHLITLVNPALLQIFGLKAEPIGETVLSTLRLPVLQTMLEGIVQDGAPQQAEVELPSRGEPRQLVISAAPLRDAAGLPRALVVVRDVSRLRRLEEMRSELVANVSHELRTPLSIFHGYLENLLETPDLVGGEVQSSLTVMRKHSLRMNALVEDLLTLARLESGRDLLEPEPIDVPAFLAETLQDWMPKAAAKEIRMGMEAPPALPEPMVDARKLHQILANLLDNALKHTPAGGTVTLRALAGEGWIEIGVQDTGAGIPPADLPHIFKRFYRADKARSRELGGTGLGLAIVKHIAHAHFGSVRAESEWGKGTTVTLRFPIGGGQ